MNKSSKSQKYLLINATLFVIIAVLLITSVTFAWFTVTNKNQALFVSQVSGVEAEYTFYKYNDPTHSGSSNLTLINNTTTNEEEYYKYYQVVNPLNATLIDGYVAPGERFSFAIKVINVGTGSGKINLAFANIISYNYPSYENRIEQAFAYEVTQISYYDETGETGDTKDLLEATYYTNHFDQGFGYVYNVTDDVSLSYQTYNSVVIYFDIYFDPYVYGVDEYGEPYTDSNIFMDQRITINTVYMTLTP